MEQTRSKRSRSMKNKNKLEGKTKSSDKVVNEQQADPKSEASNSNIVDMQGSISQTVENQNSLENSGTYNKENEEMSNKFDSSNKLDASNKLDSNNTDSGNKSDLKEVDSYSLASTVSGPSLETNQEQQSSEIAQFDSNKESQDGEESNIDNNINKNIQTVLNENNKTVLNENTNEKDTSPSQDLNQENSLELSGSMDESGTQTGGKAANSLNSSQEYVNPRGVRFTAETQDEVVLLPYGLASVRELFRFLISLCNPMDKQNTEVMLHLGLTLLTVAFEVGADSIGKYTTLLSLVKDELCRNLFSVTIL